MNAPVLHLRDVALFERPVTLRLPFRFGAATVTQCPQAFVRVRAEVNGRSVWGASAELMVPKWFDKSPVLTHEQNFEQLRQALRCARDSLSGAAGTAWQLSLHEGRAALQHAVALGLPRLAAQFGPALLDKAVADVALRAAGLGWCDGLAAGVLGDPYTAQLALHKPSQVWLRHTVGLADRLTPADPGNDPQDGLPSTLADAIDAYGLQRFKLKLCGRIDEDLARLQAIAALLPAGSAVTLDGNETFAEPALLAAFWQRFESTPALQALRQATLLLEQPLPRHLALQTDISGLGIGVPVILDESDDHDTALRQGLALGYRGISSKACKGLYRALHSAVSIAAQPGLILSGEDLTCQAGLAVQQDTLLAASLGVTHIERNGHHYVDGFGIAPDAEAQAFHEAHPGLYHRSERHKDGRVRLRVVQGQLDLQSLHGPGFAHAAEPLWSTLTPLA